MNLHRVTNTSLKLKFVGIQDDCVKKVLFLMKIEDLHARQRRFHLLGVLAQVPQYQLVCIF